MQCYVPACAVDVADTNNLNETNEQERKVPGGEVKQLQPVLTRPLAEHKTSQETKGANYTCGKRSQTVRFIFWYEKTYRNFIFCLSLVENMDNQTVGIRTAGHIKIFQSLVFLLTQLPFRQCSSLPLSAKFNCPVVRQNFSL